MAIPVRITQFVGMDNVDGGGFIDEFMLKPSLIINATIDKNRKLVKRTGYSKIIDIENCHSLFLGDNATLCVGNGQKLYELDLVNQTKTQLTTVQGPVYPLSYVEIGSLIFIANKHWCGVYENGSIRKWGKIIDDMNNLSWVRETNGSRYFLADNEGNPTATLKPHDFVHPPDPMDYITFAHGRIWGARGNVIYYSDDMSPEWFQDDVNNFEFKDKVKMIARSTGGLFVGFENYTVFLAGSHPKEMNYIYKDRGVISHTLQYTERFGDLGYDIPVWATPEGIVAGLPDGSILDLTKGTLKYDLGECVGSMFRLVNGVPQYLVTLKQPTTIVNGDEVTYDWIKDISKVNLSGNVNISALLLAFI